MAGANETPGQEVASVRVPDHERQSGLSERTMTIRSFSVRRSTPPHHPWAGGAAAHNRDRSVLERSQQ
jgi:hypothetical protein